jgi:hypothetical protein
MSDDNKIRNCKVFQSLYYKLINYRGKTLKKHQQSHIIQEIAKPIIKIIDSLCLAMFDWAKFRTAKGGIKLHRPPEVVNTRSKGT